MFFIDPVYLIFVAIPAMLLGLASQAILKYAFWKYSKVDAGTGMTGNQTAEKLNSVEDFKVKLTQVQGQLTDHYDPKNEVVALSVDNAVNTSVANLAVVAHEFGHVQQKRVGQSFFRLRSFLVPAVQFGSGVGYLMILAGIFLALTDLAWLGVALFSFTFIFALVTLPVEVDASVRGMKLIEKHNLISANLRGGAKWVLAAAALTYFAGMVQSLLQLLYFINLVQGRD